MDMDYEIIVSGHLSAQWSAVFDGMQLTCLEDGDSMLSGRLPDQAALYGVLQRIRELGLSLISVNRIYQAAKK